MSESNALVKVGNVSLPARPLVAVQEIAESFAKLSEAAHLITPIARIDFVPAMHGISLRVAQVKPEPRSGDVYNGARFLGDGEVALSKNGILKIWAASGGTIVESRRMDDGSEPHYCAWRVVGEIRAMDGAVTQYHGNKALDLRDGSALANSMKPGELQNQRAQIVSMAESKAMLRMARAALNLRQKYTAAELQKPFVCCALVFQPDMSDPEIKRMVAAKGLGIENALYGPGAPAALPAPAESPVLLAPPPIDATLDDDEDDAREPEDTSDFGPPPPPVQAAAPIQICSCPCGDQIEVSPAAAEVTRAQIGTVRCAGCYPWHRGFDFARHATIADLRVPSEPGLNVAGIRARRESAQKARTA